jgi:hypothetical protein
VIARGEDSDAGSERTSVGGLKLVVAQGDARHLSRAPVRGGRQQHARANCCGARNGLRCLKGSVVCYRSTTHPAAYDAAFITNSCDDERRNTQDVQDARGL